MVNKHHNLISSATFGGSVSRRLFSGVGANVLNQSVTVIVQLVGVPLLIATWGSQLYGEWLILFAVPAYLSMADLGFSMSAGNDMAARVSRGDHAGALTVFQSLGLFVISVTSVGLSLSAFIIWTLPIGGWLDFQGISGDGVRWVLWLLCAEVLVRLIDGVFHAGFRASGEYALHYTIYSATRLIQHGAIWIIALAGAEVVVAAISFLSVRLVSTAVVLAVLRMRHKWLRLGIGHADWILLRRLVRPAFANLAIPLAYALNVQGVILVVGAVLGPLAVVIFSTLRTLTRVVIQLILSLCNAVEPELAIAWGSKNWQLLRSLFVHTVRSTLWLALVSAGCLALFGKEILSIWTNDKIAMDSELFKWLLVSAVTSVLWYAGFSVLRATNRHLRSACIFVISSAAAVALAAISLNFTDRLSSVGFSLLLIDVVMVTYVLRAASGMLGLSLWKTILTALNPGPLFRAVVPRG